MYVPAHFAVNSHAELIEFLGKHPLGTIVVQGTAGMSAEHIPLLYYQGQQDQPGILVGHCARGNSLSQVGSTGIDCLVIFQGLQKYISPNYYASKHENGKVVPTWNYEAVHASGKLRTIDDSTRLLEILDRLTRANEVQLPKPWNVSDAPADYIEGLMKAIVGIEIEVHSLIGKSKLSQNQSSLNRESLGEHLMQSKEIADQSMGRAISQGKTWCD